MKTIKAGSVTASLGTDGMWNVVQGNDMIVEHGSLLLPLAREIIENCGGADVIKEAVMAERLRLQDFFTWLSLDYTHHSDYLWKHDKSGEFHSHQELYRE